MSDSSSSDEDGPKKPNETEDIKIDHVSSDSDYKTARMNNEEEEAEGKEESKS